MQLCEPIARRLAGYDSDGDNWATSSSAIVLRFVDKSGGDLFLKVQRHDRAATEPGLSPERTILTWLDGLLGAPRVVAFHQEQDTQYLLTEGLPGRSASSGFAEREKPRLVRLLAEGLRRVHALPTAGCPRDCSSTSIITRAEERLRGGRLPDDGREELESTLGQLRADSLPPDDLVFTHGDYCLPNIMVDGDSVSGFLDWGYAGLGDAYRDFVAAEYSVGRNLGKEWVPSFFDAYGVNPEAEKMRIHHLLYGLW